MANNAFGGKYLKRVYSGMHKSRKSLMYIVAAGLTVGLLVSLLALTANR